MIPAARKRLAAIANSQIFENALLSNYTRFAIGGPAAVFFDTDDEAAFVQALKTVAEVSVPYLVIGGGTNLVVSDEGFQGVVLHYTGSAIHQDRSLLRIGAGAVLQDVVDQSIALGLKGLETMTGIPGYLGGAVYGNAGAYGHSIQELVRAIRVYDGSKVVVMPNDECQFRYRTSILDYFIGRSRLFGAREQRTVCDRARHSHDPRREVSTVDEVRGQHLQEPARS